MAPPNQGGAGQAQARWADMADPLIIVIPSPEQTTRSCLAPSHVWLTNTAVSPWERSAAALTCSSSGCQRAD